MGNLLPPGAVGRQLTFNDFSKQNHPAPGPGQFADAAATRVSRKMSPRNVTFNRVSSLAAPNFKMVEDPDVTIVFDPNSFVENWVFTMDSTFQSSLLSHEQGHYDIASLNAQDFFVELELIVGGAFASAKAGVAKLQDTNKRLGPVQAIHNKYDLDTNHGLNVGPQAAWKAALAAAGIPGVTLLGSLSQSGLFP